MTYCNMKCKKCNSDIIAEKLMTNPPSTEYKCPNCGSISENDIKFDSDYIST